MGRVAGHKGAAPLSETVKQSPHRPREDGGVCAGFVVAGVVDGMRMEAAKPRSCMAGAKRRTGNVSDKLNAARTMVTVGRAPAAASRRRRHARANVRGSGGASPLPQHGRPSRAPRRRAAAMPTGRPPRTGGQRPKGENLGHAQRHHCLMIPVLVGEATRSAKRTCTTDARRSEVFRTAAWQVCSSGHPPAFCRGTLGQTPVFRRPPVTLAAAAPPHCARYLARRAPYSYSRVMKQAGRRARFSSPHPPVHNSARPPISVVNNWQLRFDKDGISRRSGYEHEPPPCDGQGKIFEPERCTGD